MKLDDSELNVPIYSSVCSYCKHLFLNEKRACKAFKMIPLKIWLGEHDHRKPFPGDNDIQFEPIDAEAK